MVDRPASLKDIVKVPLVIGQATISLFTGREAVDLAAAAAAEQEPSSRFGATSRCVSFLFLSFFHSFIHSLFLSLSPSLFLSLIPLTSFFPPPAPPPTSPSHPNQRHLGTTTRPR